MDNKDSLVVSHRIEHIIYTIRGHRVILDSDLATIYGVPTKVLNQAVKRNCAKFPEDFSFQLDMKEVTNLRSQFVTSSLNDNRSQFVTGSQKHRNPLYRPFVFTEHGALMAANVLKSPRAVEMSVLVVRAFVRLRKWLADHTELARRLDTLEEKYDVQFKVIFDAIRQLMLPPEPPRRKIGFHVRDNVIPYGKRRKK